MAFTFTYDITTPDGSDTPTEGDDRIREVKKAVQERINVEHVFDLDGDEVSGDNTGKHTDITCDSIVNGGTLAVTGLSTLQSLTLASGATPVEFSTDGTLAGDADDAVPTEKAVKTYVDAIDSADDFTPSDYTNDGSGDSNESVTLPNGMIMKMGKITRDASALTTVTFDTAFPNGIVSAQVTPNDDPFVPGITNLALGTVNKTKIEIKYATTDFESFYWFAIGF